MKKEMVDAMKTIQEHMEVRKQNGWSLQGLKETKEKVNKEQKTLFDCRITVNEGFSHNTHYKTRNTFG